MINANKFCYCQHFRIFIISLLFCFCNIISANTKIIAVEKKRSVLNDSLESIKICKWKNNAKTCVNFSFDDGLPSFRRISQIFDLYDFKASFFIIATTMQVDSVRDIYARGHEIASHSYSHPLFEVLDSSQIEYQIRKGQEILENTIGFKCLCFGEPGNFRSSLCESIAFKYHLFVRHYSEYKDVERIEMDLQPKNLIQIIPTIQQGISKGCIVEFVAHSINGEGFLPINESLFMQQLDSIKSYVQNGDVWVSTNKEGFSYENLYHEIVLNRTLLGDTLKLEFNNYNKAKYKDLDASVLSIEIPYSVAKDLYCPNDFVKGSRMNDKMIFTTDLKIDTCMILISNHMQQNIKNEKINDLIVQFQEFKKN